VTTLESPLEPHVCTAIARAHLTGEPVAAPSDVAAAGQDIPEPGDQAAREQRENRERVRTPGL
jgi:hypothetical protein